MWGQVCRRWRTRNLTKCRLATSSIKGVFRSSRRVGFHRYVGRTLSVETDVLWIGIFEFQFCRILWRRPRVKRIGQVKQKCLFSSLVWRIYPRQGVFLSKESLWQMVVFVFSDVSRPDARLLNIFALFAHIRMVIITYRDNIYLTGSQQVEESLLKLFRTPCGETITVHVYDRDETVKYD